MRSKLSRFRPSPAAVISVIALFFAIGGIGYAAATIGTSDIKKGAVTKKKLHKNSVTSKKVRNGSLKRKDLGFDPTGPRGPEGPRGPAGPQGPAGPAGPGQAFNFVLGANETASVSAGGFALATEAAGNGECDLAALFASKPSRFEAVDYVDDQVIGHDSVSASTPVLIDIIGDSEMGVVTAYANDGTGVAQFEYTLDDIGAAADVCHFAGTAIGR